MGLKFSNNLKNVLQSGDSTFSLERNGDNYFSIPTNDDLNYSNLIENDSSIASVKKYVNKHTSGTRINYELSDEGSMLVTFSKFIEMIDNGYNIYESHVINSDLINIKFQKEIKPKGKKK